MTNHIFLLDTELQCFASLKIIETEAIKDPIFLCFNPKVYAFLTQNSYEATLLEKKSKGLFGQTRALHKVITKITEHINESNVIYLHRLDLIYTNIVIGTLCRKHNIEVRIVPEGVLNYVLEDASVRWKKRSKRWPIRICYGMSGLRKYEINGERVGVDTPVVSTAYAFAGVKSPYPADKVKYISFFQSASVAPPSQSKKALVIGQPMPNRKNIPVEEVEQAISDKIFEILTKLEVDQIDYAPHPRDKMVCLLRDEYQKVQHSYICLEQYLEQHNYDILISCCSTSLLTAKLIFGQDIQSIAVGMNTVLERTPETLKNLTTLFQNAGIEMIDL